MDFPKIHESEYRFCLIMWEHEPVTAVELVKLCQDQLGWKRTTTYTVIKRLGERGVLKLSLIHIQMCIRDRKKNWKPRELRYKSGVLRMFSEHAASPMKGAYLEF